MSLSFCVEKIESTGVGFSYTGFNKFRHRIARSIGLKGVYPGTDTDMYVTNKYKEIESEHPMFPLIDHNDNDGKLEPDDCGTVGAYLKTLIPEWEKEFDEYPEKELENDIMEGKKLADLMLQCYENNETLLFI
jgi:hypothetical protein